MNKCLIPAIVIVVAWVSLGGASTALGQSVPDGIRYPASRLSAAGALKDIRLLRTALEHIHPGYDRYASAARLRQEFEKLENLSAEGITDEGLYLETSAILAMIRCGHTKAELPKALEDFRRKVPSYLPFGFRIFDGRMYVDRGMKATKLPRSSASMANDRSKSWRKLDHICRLMDSQISPAGSSWRVLTSCWEAE